MWITIKIALRNLFRQKKRNILLGIGIAFGMSILVIAVSFTNGMTNLILNHFMKNAIGHIGLTVTEKTGTTVKVIRDKEYFMKLIRSNVSDIEEVNGNFQQFTRVIGNGTSDMMALVSQSRFGNGEFFNFWGAKVEEGNIYDFTNKTINNPIMLYSKKAETLKVKVGDTIKVRLRTIYGQSQAATLTVVATIKSQNDMESMAGYVNMESMQMLAGYTTNEVGDFLINLSNVNDAHQTVAVADKLHDALIPQPVIIDGLLMGGTAQSKIKLISYATNTNAQNILKQSLKLSKGSIDYRKEGGVVISTALAKKLGLSIGSSLSINYISKYEGKSPVWNLKVTAIADFPGNLGPEVAMISMLDLYDNMYEYWPRMEDNLGKLTKEDKIYAALATPYQLLPRTYNMNDYRKKQQSISTMKIKGALLDIRSMSEIADMILQVEKVLVMIAVIWVLILFVIITVGVVNTLHMTIKERTREIGTIRAIGMQAKMVRRTFVMESTFLSFFATIAGTIFALIVMGVFSLLELKPEGMISMLLKDGHLYFIPPVGMIINCMVIIVLMTVVVAYFPARKAAKISAADALRHYE